MAALHEAGAQRGEIVALARQLREGLNPHPAGQLEMNRPRNLAGKIVDGLQHKYRETVLFFPSQGQICHSYCTFCFRWAQFVGDKELRIASSEAEDMSGLSRTARGPSMSAGPGKVEVQGVTEVQGEKVFVLRFLQGRNPDWVQRPFFARFDPDATWLDQLRPAFGERRFFFEDEYASMLPAV